jgi:hypothetical protein
MVVKEESMSEQNYSIDRDLKEAAAMANALIPYVYDDRMYVTVGGNIPSFTLGALLLRLRRLRALRNEMTSNQQSKLAEIESQHDSVLKEWHNAYAKKIAREALSRLEMMDHYFEECRENPRIASSAYSPEALRRTIVEEIALMLHQLRADSPEFDLKRKKTDSQLRQYVRPSDFIWSPMLQPIYPQDTFWWLYHKPQL